jgi:hypothetical protein
VTSVGIGIPHTRHPKVPTVRGHLPMCDDVTTTLFFCFHPQHMSVFRTFRLRCPLRCKLVASFSHLPPCVRGVQSATQTTSQITSAMWQASSWQSLERRVPAAVGYSRSRQLRISKQCNYSFIHDTSRIRERESANAAQQSRTETCTHRTHHASSTSLSSGLAPSRASRSTPDIGLRVDLRP